MNKGIGFLESGLFSAPIVGMAFRPPAKALMQTLPASCKMRVEREPENQYDADAIKVFVHGTEVPQALSDEKLDAIVEGFGFSAQEIRSQEWFIGYIANSDKTGGKFASELQKHFDQIEECRLGFDMAGSPRLLIRLKDGD